MWLLETTVRLHARRGEPGWFACSERRTSPLPITFGDGTLRGPAKPVRPQNGAAVLQCDRRSRLREPAKPVRPQNGAAVLQCDRRSRLPTDRQSRSVRRTAQPFCNVTAGHAFPRHSLRSLGGPTSVIATPTSPGAPLRSAGGTDLRSSNPRRVRVSCSPRGFRVEDPWYDCDGGGLGGLRRRLRRRC